MRVHDNHLAQLNRSRVSWTNGSGEWFLSFLLFSHQLSKHSCMLLSDFLKKGIGDLQWIMTLVWISGLCYPGSNRVGFQVQSLTMSTEGRKSGWTLPLRLSYDCRGDVGVPLVPLLPKTDIGIHCILWGSSFPRKASCWRLNRLYLACISLVNHKPRHCKVFICSFIDGILQRLLGRPDMSLEFSGTPRVPIFSIVQPVASHSWSRLQPYGVVTKG